MVNKLSDSWETPQWLFDELNAEFNFGIDLCASRENSKCNDYYEDYLNNVVLVKSARREYWYREEGLSIYEDAVCFMNPPYSNPKPFIEKAWEDSKYCKIVCLLKVDPSTKWWAIFWDYGKKEVEVNVKVCLDCGVDVRRGLSGFTWCFGCDLKGISSGTNTEVRIVKEIIDVPSKSKPGCEVRFLPKRVKFDAPKGWEGKQTGPSFASCIVIMDRRYK